MVGFYFEVLISRFLTWFSYYFKTNSREKKSKSLFILFIKITKLKIWKSSSQKKWGLFYVERIKHYSPVLSTKNNLKRLKVVIRKYKQLFFKLSSSVIINPHLAWKEVKKELIEDHQALRIRVILHAWPIIWKTIIKSFNIPEFTTYYNKFLYLWTLAFLV